MKTPRLIRFLGRVYAMFFGKGEEPKPKEETGELIPALPVHARNIFRWKYQYVEFEQHGFPPSHRVKICVPKEFVRTPEKPAIRLTLVLSNEDTRLELKPYNSGSKPEYTDEGMAQFEPRSTLPEWGSLMAGAITVSLLDDDGTVLMRLEKRNPKQNYSGMLAGVIQ